MQISTALLAALTMFGTPNMSAATDASTTIIPDCVVVAIHDSDVPADLPAQQGGVLRTINVKIGDHVTEGDVLATVDDQQEKLSLEVSRQRLVMAEKEADNDVNERYARAAAGVYQYRYKMVEEAVQKVPDAYSQSEVMTYLLQANQYALQTEQAVHERNLAQLAVRVREAEFELAKHELERRQIRAPVDGVIEDVYPVDGDWVRAGDPIVRLIKMDRLNIKGTFAYGQLTPGDVRGKNVIVRVPLARGQVGEFTGKVDSTGADFGSGEIKIIAEVQNRTDPQTKDWLLMPGMRGEMQILDVGKR